MEGDDGELYALGGSILSMNLEKMDLVTICMAKGKGRVRQLPSSIYKVAEYPGAVLNKMIRNPQGTMQIEKRERYVAVDSSAAELGGWEDWGYITFNELHSSMYDMRLGMKDFAIYDLENDRYYPEGKMTIEHEDWAFMRELDGFVPTWYNIKIEVGDGVYEVRAHVCNARTWGVTFQVPDNPVATLIYDTVEGKFTYKDGRVRMLTGGRGTMSIRQ